LGKKNNCHEEERNAVFSEDAFAPVSEKALDFFAITTPSFGELYLASLVERTEEMLTPCT